MKRKKTCSNIKLCWMLIPLALILWSLWPQPSTIHALKIDQAFLDPALMQSCPLLRRLSAYEFELKLPQRIWKTEEANLILTLRAPESITPLTAEEQDACGLALETNLIAGHLLAKPGNILIEPFVGEETQSFLYAVSLQDEESARGEVWIYADVKPAGAQSTQRLPLFSIPLEASAVSILGLPPALVRYMSLLAMLVMLALSFRRRLYGRG